MPQYWIGDFPNLFPQQQPLPQPFLPPPPQFIWQGCVCPAGANVTCENPSCPRKPARPISATRIA